MKIQGINVSAVVRTTHAGRRIRTGFFKCPVDGPVAVGRINLAGDDQADRKNHGGEHKAVYAFSADEYAHWRAELGRDDLAPGFFGENLTVEGLDETVLAVGDRLRAGNVLFEITQPRVPCFKLGMACGRDDAPRRFIDRARPGVYLRVLQQGSLVAGTALSREPGPGADDDVAALYRAAFDTSLDRGVRLATIERALVLEALSDEWGDFLRKRRRSLKGADA